MDGVIPAARVMARLLTACAVLVGLMFMHSLGAAIGTVCPGGTSSMTTSVALPAAAGGHDAPMAEAITTMPGTALLATAPHPAGHGTVCVSTPPRGELTGPVTLAATGLAQPAALGQPSPGIARVGGAVPRAGPALLISLCVSRT